MRHTSVITVLVLGLTTWLFGLPLEGHAKPKSTVFGCSTQDLQTNFASSCIHQAEQDIMNGNSYVHVVICEGGQQKCCTVSDSGQILNCRRPAGSAALTQPLQRLTPMNPRLGSVQSRDVEGGDDVGEETPVPSWLNKEWIEEHDGKEPAK